MATGSLTFYTRAFFFSVRPSFTARASEWAASGMLNVRYYLSGTTDYLSLKAGSGSSADERSLQSSAGFNGRSVYFLASQFIGVGIMHPLNNRLQIAVNADYLLQELGFDLGRYVSVYGATVGMQVKL
jgi:YaiO family outer membrane protein